MRASLNRRALGLAVAAALAAPAALAQDAGGDWPAGDLRVMVPYAPGGTSDNFARAVVPALEDILDVSITVENIGGAGGTIGLSRLAGAPADGSVFGFTPDAPLTIAPNMRRTAYDPIADIQPVARVALAIGGLAVRPDFPADSMAEFVAYMRDHPGEVSFGSAGVGATTHLYVELMQDQLGVEVTHVPFKGSGEAINNLMGGHVDALFDYSPLLAQSRAGTVKPIAMLKADRWDGLPEVPTMAEAGHPELRSIISYGAVAPAGTPEAAVAGMARALARAIEDPAVLERFETLGLVPDFMGPEAAAERIAADHAFFAETLAELELARN